MAVAFIIKASDEESEPTCDICARREDDSPNRLSIEADWNPETGNHESCESLASMSGQGERCTYLIKYPPVPCGKPVRAQWVTDMGLVWACATHDAAIERAVRRLNVSGTRADIAYSRNGSSS
jgi:hypothetical protein